MKIKLLIVSEDRDYVEALARGIDEQYEGKFEIHLCFSPVKNEAVTAGKSYGIVLEDQSVKWKVLPFAKLYAVLWSDELSGIDQSQYLYIKKYQRISKIVSELLEQYARVEGESVGLSGDRGRITVLWSPAGGMGKTTVAMAYAAGQAVQGKQVIYLDLEYFSSTEVYFSDEAKSISRLFEAINSKANMEVLTAGLKKRDSASGIMYFGRPDNYDDINILTVSDLEEILDVCIAQCDELVIDLPSVCEEKVRYLFERAEKVLTVLDGSVSGMRKWGQFQTQHNVYERIAGKQIMVINRGGEASGIAAGHVVRLPLVRSKDPMIVYKTLSAHKFE